MSNQTQVFDNPTSIRLFQLASARKAIKLESLGMRHSRLARLGGAKGLWAKHYGLSPRVKHQVVIDRITQEMSELEEKLNAQPELPL